VKNFKNSQKLSRIFMRWALAKRALEFQRVIYCACCCNVPCHLDTFFFCGLFLLFPAHILLFEPLGGPHRVREFARTLSKALRGFKRKKQPLTDTYNLAQTR
jgi:hypothetical protein